MAFESLTDKLQNVFKNLRSKGRLTEADVKEAMKEVKRALLEADVNFRVVKSFVKTVTDRAIGQDVLTGLNPGQMVIKIVKEDTEGLSLQIPPYRVDVRREADVIEDILRIYGFNNIEDPSKVNSTLSYSEIPDDFQLKNKIADLLAANGFNEIMINSLTKASYYEHLETYRPEDTVMLFNPLSSDLSAMRQSLLFGGLEPIAYNINRKNSNLRLFVIGKAYTFHKKEGENHLKQYKEEDKLALFITGDKIQASWNSKEQKTDFFNLKSYAEMILIRLGFKTEMLTLEECSADIYREGISYTQNGKHIVTIGMLSHKVMKSNDIEQ